MSGFVATILLARGFFIAMKYKIWYFITNTDVSIAEMYAVIKLQICKLGTIIEISREFPGVLLIPVTNE